jgi:hypothetical protein
MHGTRRTTTLAVAGLLLLVGCAKGASSTTTAPTTSAPPTSTAPPSHSPKPSGTASPIPVESPVPTESSPPGDIPDNTQFVPYRTKGGFAVSVPEGWARTTTKTSVTFTDKLNTIVASWESASGPPTVTSATHTEVPQLQGTERAFTLGDVKETTLPTGRAVLISFQENSAPSAVTGKQYRLDVLRYELFRGGTEAVITLLSPVGADNVDPWRTVTESFTWS